MYEVDNYSGMVVNTDVARAFRQIVTAGWANLSDGSVERPNGHFAIIHIEDNELRELLDAVFDGDSSPAIIEPGSYLLQEDSDGNSTLYFFRSLVTAMPQFDGLQEDDTQWMMDNEQKYLVHICGEAFSFVVEPGSALVQLCWDHAKDCTQSTGNDWEWKILPESEAM